MFSIWTTRTCIVWLFSIHVKLCVGSAYSWIIMIWSKTSHIVVIELWCVGLRCRMACVSNSICQHPHSSCNASPKRCTLSQYSSEVGLSEPERVPFPCVSFCCPPVWELFWLQYWTWMVVGHLIGCLEVVANQTVQKCLRKD